MLLLLAGFVKTASECISIQQTSICNPWNDRMLSVDAISKVYGIDPLTFSPQIWEQKVIETTQGGKVQEQLWKSWVFCEGYDGEPFQYSLTYTCLTDIFVFSKGCNQPDSKSALICPETCKSYGQAVNKMFSNETTCPTDFGGIDPAQVEVYEKRRNAARMASDSCVQFSENPSFNPQSQCILGVEMDQKSCGTDFLILGFGGNQGSSRAFCEAYPNDPCCSTVIPLQQQQVPNGNSYATEQKTGQKKSSIVAGAVRAGAAPAAYSEEDNDYFDDEEDPIERSTSFEAAASKLVTVPGKSKVWLFVAAGVGIVTLLGILAFVYRQRSRSKVSSVSIKEVKNIESGKADGVKLKCIVKYAYSPNLPDEMELQVGDLIVFENLSDDGWGDARNLTSGEEGKACTRFMEPVD